ncbi:MAG: triose-phosphate isomerase [Patescibacteria group bacterium]|nr:triose-phosphate isomerase [Patescibacteria group bacterium]
MIFLNFKIYQQTSADHTLKLCRLIQDKRVIPCLQAVDIYRIKTVFPDLEVWAQHADPVDYGKFTGYQSPLTLKTAGASGVLLNHAEHQLDLATIKATTIFCRQAGLKTIILAANLDQIKQFNLLKPDYIGYEDPQLIGGPVAMIDAHFNLIKQAASVSQAPLIVGGGIRTTEHVKKSFLAGGQGVLVASEFAKSSHHEQTLQELILGLDH